MWKYTGGLGSVKGVGASVRCQVELESMNGRVGSHSGEVAGGCTS